MVAQLSLSPTYDKHLHEVQDELARTKPQHLVFVSQTHELVTDSFLIAKYFGKRHDNVLQKIKTLDCSCEFTNLNFQVCHKNNELQNNKLQPFYQMTKDGFMFLVMGFTGKKAAMIKEAYINAFNAMEEQIHQPKITLPNLTRQRILTTVENGEVIAQRFLADDELVMSRKRYISYFKEPDIHFSDVEQLSELSKVVNERLIRVCQR